MAIMFDPRIHPITRPGAITRPPNAGLPTLGPPDVRTPAVMPTRTGRRFLRGGGGGRGGSQNRF